MNHGKALLLHDIMLTKVALTKPFKYITSIKKKHLHGMFCVDVCCTVLIGS